MLHVFTIIIKCTFLTFELFKIKIVSLWDWFKTYQAIIEYIYVLWSPNFRKLQKRALGKKPAPSYN